jgi:hypothetical protein
MSGKQIAGTLQELLLPLAHLDRVDGIDGGDLLDRLAATKIAPILWTSLTPP